MTRHPIEVRALLPDEWSLFRDIRLEALQTDPAVFGSSYAREVDRDEAGWRERLEDPTVQVFGVFVGDELVGMTGVAVSRDNALEAMLWGSWLRPAFRRQGLSSPMYEARIAWARARPDLGRIVVSHRASNLASKVANQRHGFQLTHSVERSWRDGTAEPDLHYELPLSGSEG